MRKLILFFLLLAGVAYGQTPNATNTKFTNGLAVPNGVTQKPTSGLTAGALSYVTGAGLYVYNGSAWVLLGLSSGGVTSFNARTGVVVPEIGDYSSFYVPLTRSLTINGATQTLAADRTWTITANTPNSLSTGYGLTGGVFDGSVARTYAADTLSVGGLVSKLRLATNLTGYVKKATTITINGVTQDLSDNRIWTAGTVTSITPGYGLTPQTAIASSGSFGVDTLVLDTVYAKIDSLGNYVQKTGDTMTGTLNGTDIVLSGDILADSIKTIGGLSTEFLKGDGSVTTLSFGTFGSTPNAQGGSYSGGVITLRPADATNPGGVTTGIQTWAGVKTFTDQINITSGGFVINANAGTTLASVMDLRNATGITRFGTASNAGGDTFAGSSPNASVFGSSGATPLEFFTNNVLRGSFSSSGAFSATGSISSTPQGTLYGTASGSITSAQLATSLTDETGTGSAVFSASPTFTGTVTIPKIIVNTTTDTGTPDAAVLIDRTLSGATSSGHGIADRTAFTTPSVAYNPFDAQVVMGNGTAINFDHLSQFQARSRYNSTGTIGFMSGFDFIPFATGSGTISNMYGLHVWNLQSGTPTITNNYGIKLDSMTVGTNKYGIVQRGAALNIFEGQSTFGAVTTNGSVTFGARALFETTSIPSAQGQDGYSSTNGRYIWPKSGSFSDFTLYNSAGGTVLYNPTGTANTELLGKIIQTTSSTATAQGQQGYNASAGHYIWPKAGADYDYFLYNSAGNATLYVPTGTTDIVMGNDLTIGGSNATKASGTAWINPSDLRLKMNIGDYSKGLKEVLAIQPKTWYFNKASGYDQTQKHLSPIAQELKKVMPEMVSTYKGKLNGKETELLRVDASDMTWLLVKAIQEQQAIIEKLNARITLLENK